MPVLSPQVSVPNQIVASLRGLANGRDLLPGRDYTVRGLSLAEVQRRRGWPASLIAAANTRSFILTVSGGLYGRSNSSVWRKVAIDGRLVAMAIDPWQWDVAYGVMLLASVGMGCSASGSATGPSTRSC